MVIRVVTLVFARCAVERLQRAASERAVVAVERRAGGGRCGCSSACAGADHKPVAAAVDKSTSDDGTIRGKKSDRQTRN